MQSLLIFGMNCDANNTKQLSVYPVSGKLILQGQTNFVGHGPDERSGYERSEPRAGYKNYVKEDFRWHVVGILAGFYKQINASGPVQ